MKRFKFTLESVLTLRQKALEDARINLAKIVKIFNTQKEVLEGMENELQRNIEESEKIINEIGENSLNIQMTLNYRTYCQKLSNDIQTQKLIIEQTEKQVQHQQEIAKEAYIKVKTLEKLKENQKEKYKKLLEQEEFKTIDDIVNSRRKAS